MAIIAPINLPYNVRTLWFDPNGLEISAGDKVVVRTARGLELGVAASELKEVDDESVSKLKSPLKPVLRLATDEDIAKADEMERLSKEAMPVFKELARDTSEDMHPVSVEYLLDGDKAVFYFEAEERIDFRDLVRQLASIFHVRIDMHQIGVRDEARIVGGLAHCGQEVCCKRLGGEFKPVSIRMAKDQDLSLNPQKISGLCGRLMCCLRYENEAYKDFKGRAPKIGSTIHTPEGDAKVIDYDVPREIVVVKSEDGKSVKVPLIDFDSPQGTSRPDSVSEESWESAKASDDPIGHGAVIFSTSQFTGTDTLGTAKAIHHDKSHSSDSNSSDEGQAKSESKKTRGENRHKRANADSNSETKPRQRRRRSTTIKGGEAMSDNTASDKDAKSEKASSKAALQKQSSNSRASSNKANRSSEKGTQQSRAKRVSQERGVSHDVKLRPGHRSSGLSEGRNAALKAENESEQNSNGSANRRRRRRKSSKVSGSPKSEGGTN